jgi:hypothetical protein
MVLDRTVGDVESLDGGLDCGCVSRLAAMRSVRDCRVVALRSETRGEAVPAIGLDGVSAPIRLPMSLVAPELGLPLRGDCKGL